ncbi:unnamed protein product [Closterium sp. NIES-65]|nr:unnamed protein product [Closterium sp. NIES-65]CAI5992708.1 unnamed protein product [Closterium sp. NIES-65]
MDMLGPFLTGLSDRGKLLLAGDLNVVEDPILDKSLGGGSSEENDRMLQLNLFSGLHMADTFRTLNPGSRERYATEERKRVRVALHHLELTVSGLQQELMRNPHLDDLRTFLTEKESQLAAYLKGENDRLHCFAGVKEEMKGEIASKVLSAKVKSKKSRTMITALSSHGVEQRGKKGNLAAASQFYSTLFAENPPSGLPCWKPDMLKTLRDEEKAGLDADWSEEEVKEALKNMACDKSPGSDGLPKELFEYHWDLLRGDFMGFIKQFESSAFLPEEV